MNMAAVALAVEKGVPRDDKIQVLDTWKPVAYFPPYPVKINPHYLLGGFQEKAQQWMLHLKVDTFVSPKIFKMLQDMNICDLVARVYTEAGVWELEWACKLFFLLWIYDDTLDDFDMGKSTEDVISNFLDALLVMMWSFPDDPVMRTQLEFLLGRLDGEKLEEKTRYIDSVLAEARSKPGTVYSKEMSGLCNVYLDWWIEAVTGVSPEFSLRMAHCMQQWLSGCLKESDNRTTKTNAEYIDLDDYVENRRGTSGVLPALLIVDKLHSLSTPDSWFNSPEMQRTMDAVTDIISWHNDIWSFKREVLIEKELQNIVLLISVKQKISYTEAVEVTTHMLYDRIADLDQAISDLEAATLPEHRQSFELYTLTFKNWVSGTQDWHANSIRYQ